MNIRLFLFTFSVIFAKIWHNFAKIIQNELNFLRQSVVAIIRDRKTLLNCLIEDFFGKKLLIKFSKLKLFSSKMAQNKLSWSTLLKFA